jgi:aminoglycoside phosphotransferase (APT) family kinase protein
MVAQLVGSGTGVLAERYADAAPNRVLSAVVEAAGDWKRVLARCADGPQTLVHNDCRTDNLFFADDGTPSLIDWQGVARTRGTQDVGYLLAGSMASDELAIQWRELVARYHARLLARGVRSYSLDQCIEHYRINVLYALGAGIALIGAMDIGDQGALGDAIIRRSLRHVTDLDSLGAL